MEFDFSIRTLLPDEVTIINKDHYLVKSSFFRSNGAADNNLRNRENLAKVVNTLGQKSAEAQGLKSAITSIQQLQYSTQRCYILKAPESSKLASKVVGFLKVGVKRLFFVDATQQQVEVNPLCVLDFYIHESCQRQGYGLKLFNFMLEKEEVLPEQLAIDRPSDKMVSFYHRRFGLHPPLRQPNSYVVYKEFFSSYSATSPKKWTDHQPRGPVVLRPIKMKSNLKVRHHPVREDINGQVTNEPNGLLFPDNQPKTHTDVEKPESNDVIGPRKEEDGKTDSKSMISDIHDPLKDLPSILSRPLSTFVASNSNHDSVVVQRPNVYSRDKSVNKELNDNFNYYAGITNRQLMAQSRYLHRNKPRPF